MTLDMGMAATSSASSPKKPSGADIVLSTIRSRGLRGATDDEIEIITGLAHASASARRNDLLYAGWIAPRGDRRPTRTGRSAKVWIIADATTLVGLKVQGRRKDRPSKALIRQAVKQMREGNMGSREVERLLQWLEGVSAQR